MSARLVRYGARGLLVSLPLWLIIGLLGWMTDGGWGVLSYVAGAFGIAAMVSLVLLAVGGLLRLAR